MAEPFEFFEEGSRGRRPGEGLAEEVPHLVATRQVSFPELLVELEATAVA